MKQPLLRILFLSSLLLPLLSCSNEHEIVGEWKGIEGKNNFAVETLEFEADGAFYFGTTLGEWEETDPGRIEIRFKNVLPNSYDYIVRDGQLTLKDQVGVAGVFERVK